VPPAEPLHHRLRDCAPDGLRADDDVEPVTGLLEVRDVAEPIPVGLERRLGLMRDPGRDLDLALRRPTAGRADLDVSLVVGACDPVAPVALLLLPDQLDRAPSIHRLAVERPRDLDLRLGAVRRDLPDRDRELGAPDLGMEAERGEREPGTDLFALLLDVGPGLSGLLRAAARAEGVDRPRLALQPPCLGETAPAAEPAGTVADGSSAAWTEGLADVHVR